MFDNILKVMESLALRERSALVEGSKVPVACDLGEQGIFDAPHQRLSVFLAPFHGASTR